MRLIPSDPNRKTIIDKIKEKDINLQPDFQRGEVWNVKKQKRLIDSILRDWHVPPIHVVEVTKTGEEEVLDGQQRLVAIRDFVQGKYSVDGYTEPINDDILKLDGLKYDQLSDVWRRKFDKFTIRFFTIVDYHPEEPWELFYRLNETTKLTSAEQRNAFYGPARQQVKELVEMFSSNELLKDIIGFDNSRMAYDDIIAKLCYTLEIATIQQNISGANITNKYRSRIPFNKDVYQRANEVILAFENASSFFSNYSKFNKATLYSWLCFIAKASSFGNLSPYMRELGEFINFFEILRSKEQKRNIEIPFYQYQVQLSLSEKVLLNIFNDRASSRVANTLSVITRDLIIWIFYLNYGTNGNSVNNNPFFNDLVRDINYFRGIEEEEDVYSHLSHIIEKYDWGSSI
jgi:hypothetical protein